MIQYNTIQITICNAPYFARRIRGADTHQHHAISNCSDFAISRQNLSINCVTCHLILLSPVNHHHHHHHYHHFHCASLDLCSNPDSKLTFSINSSHCSLPHFFVCISNFYNNFRTFQISSTVFLFCFSLIHLFV